MPETRNTGTNEGAGGRTFGPGSFSVMGILNVTPDSFSDPGEFFDAEKAVPHALRMLDEGAGIIDVGGESTRPGSDPVEAEEERRRVVPVIREVLAERPDATISIDTYRASTAEAALGAGARIINDVTAMRGDSRMPSLMADSKRPIVLMHMKGEPKTMQNDPRYDDVVRDVREFLSERAEFAISSGVSSSDIILDPGIGFGKTLEHNLLLLKHLGEIVDLGFPVLVGTSRKGFIGKLASEDGAGGRVFGTIATSILAYEHGATLFRVHDVKANKDALEVAAALRRV